MVVLQVIYQVIVPDIDPLTLDSIFPRPGRNEACSCNSGVKYKNCCLSVDEETWRVLAQKTREADAALKRIPKSIHSEYNP
jgi:hypothetical protein